MVKARARSRAAGIVAFLCALPACGSVAPPAQPKARDEAASPTVTRGQALPLAQSSVRRATPEQLAEEIRPRLSRPEGGFAVTVRPDGGRRLALDGHLQHAVIAVVAADGSVHTTCVDNPRAAARALGAAQSVVAP